MIDQNTLQDFTRTLQKYKAGKASLERRVVAAESWWKLRNRATERRDAEESYRSVSGWLHNVIVSKHADAMDAFPEPVILPREPGDEREARMLSAVVPCILELNRFEQVYDAAMWQKLKTGTAAYRVVWDGDKCGGLGDIAVERVDLLNLFWEPGVDDIQKSRYVFHTHLEDEEELTERYPQLRGRLRSNAFQATRFVYDDAVDLSGKQTVIEVYYKKRGALHYCKYVGDCVLYATEDGGPMWASAPTPEPGDYAVGADAHIRPQTTEPVGLYDHGLYPFVLDPLFPIEGSPCGYGFVDLCQNTQTAIDLMRTAFVKNTMVGATPRYFQRMDGSVNEEEFADLDRALVHVSGNLGEDSLRPIPYAPLSPVYVKVLNSTIAELRETSGNTETATGNVHSGITAASAIAALQEASGKGSRDASRASYVAFGKIVELCIELIRQFYTLPRRFRITGAGGDEFVSYSNAGLLPQPMAWPGMDGDPRAAEGVGPYGSAAGAALLRKPVFDVKVSAQKRSVYARLSQNELAMQLYKLGLFEPGRENQALQCLELMDFDGKEELRRRLLAGSGLREKLEELGRYKALALALTRRYRPDMLGGLTGDGGPRRAGGELPRSGKRGHPGASAPTSETADHAVRADSIRPQTTDGLARAAAEGVYP